MKNREWRVENGEWVVTYGCQLFSHLLWSNRNYSGSRLIRSFADSPIRSFADSPLS